MLGSGDGRDGRETAHGLCWTAQDALRRTETVAIITVRCCRLALWTMYINWTRSVELMSGCSPVCPHVSAAEWLGGFLLNIVVRYSYKSWRDITIRIKRSRTRSVVI